MAYPGTEGKKSSTTASPHSARPWSSGRALTSVQRERKRRMNRISKRERQKLHTTRIVSIEKRITNLERQCLSLKGESCTYQDANYAMPRTVTRAYNILMMYLLRVYRPSNRSQDLFSKGLRPYEDILPHYRFGQSPWSSGPESSFGTIGPSQPER